MTHQVVATLSAKKVPMAQAAPKAMTQPTRERRTVTESKVLLSRWLKSMAILKLGCNTTVKREGGTQGTTKAIFIENGMRDALKSPKLLSQLRNPFEAKPEIKIMQICAFALEHTPKNGGPRSHVCQRQYEAPGWKRFEIQFWSD